MLTAQEFLAASELRDAHVGEDTVAAAIAVARVVGVEPADVAAAFADVRADVSTLFDAVTCSTGTERSFSE